MSDETVMLTAEERWKANLWLSNHLQRTLNDGTREGANLRGKLAITYWILIVLSLVMFSAGIVLISVPAWAAFRGPIGEAKALIAGGFGFADLVSLFLLRPIDKIHRLMGDGMIFLDDCAP